MNLIKNYVNKLYYILGKQITVKIGWLIFLVIVSSVFDVFGISFVVDFISSFDSDESTISLLKRFLPFIYNNKNLYAIFIFVYYTLKNLIQYFTECKKVRLSAEANNSLNKKLLNSYLKNEYEYFTNTNSAEINSKLNIGITNVCETCVSIIDFVSNIFFIIAIFVYLFYCDFKLTIIIFFFILLISLFFLVLFTPKSKKYGKLLLEKSKFRTKWTMQSLNGIKELKINNVEKIFEQEISNYTEQYFEIFSKYFCLNSLPLRLFEVLIISLIIFFMFVIINVSFSLNLLSKLFAFAYSLFLIYPKISNLNASINGFIFKHASIDVIYQDLKNSSLNKNSFITSETKEISFNESLTVSGLNFKYRNSSNFIFENVNFKIKKGDYVAFVGSSGAGKTTIIDILVELLKPTSGNIFVDSEILSDREKDWQKHIGYISQNPFLFDDSIINNITLNENNPDMNLVQEIINKIGMQEFVNSFSDGINHSLGEFGVQVSGGQKQRIAIARALYKKADVLVLDEATSALDEDAEREIMNIIDSLIGKVTVFTISHRPSVIKNCNRFFRVYNKDVIEIDKKEIEALHI